MLTVHHLYIKPLQNNFFNNTFNRQAVTNVDCSYDGISNSNDWHKNDVVKEEYKESSNERAILLQSSENYAFIKNAFPKLIKKDYGTFGENIVVSGLKVSDISIGDIFIVKSGESKLTIQVTSPRKPCFKIDRAHKSLYGLHGLKRYSLTHGVGGWFCKILVPGKLSVKDELIRISNPYPKWSIEFTSKCLYSGGNYKIQSRCSAYWYETKELLEELASIKELATCEWREEVIKLLNNYT